MKKNIYAKSSPYFYFLISITLLFSCNKEDNVKENLVEKYTPMVYGQWYREINSELSRYFESYNFSANKNVIRYTKSASRNAFYMEGNTSYSNWKTEEYTTIGIWHLEQLGNLVYLRIKWDMNDFYGGSLIYYIDNSTFSFDSGFNSDLIRGNKEPNF